MSALKSVDFPTFGRPTIPIESDIPNILSHFTSVDVIFISTIDYIVLKSEYPEIT